MTSRCFKRKIEIALKCLITIAFKDGDDTPLYLEKLLQQAIQELAIIEAEEPEE
jgi:hypothetical protein